MKDKKLFYVGALLVHCVTGTVLKNVAYLKPTQSSSKFGGDIYPSRANDGSYRSHWHLDSSCFATGSDLQPWWMVDLQAIYKIKGFMVVSRQDCCPHQLKDFTVEIFLENPVDVPTAVASLCYFYSGYPTPGVPDVLDCDEMVVGRYFRMRMNPKGNDKVLTICEVEVYSPSSFKCSRYTGMMNARVPHEVSLVVNTPIECFEACVNLGLCIGFNFKKAEVSECQIVSKMTSPLKTSQGWRFYQYKQC